MNKRTEKEIFSDLESVCLAEGYVYVLAWICIRDDMIYYTDKIQVSDFERLHSPERVIRTELSMLAGLMAKGDISIASPSSESFQQLVDKTDSLLKELHDFFNIPLSVENLSDGLEGVLQSKNFFREAFFYSGEPAYYFQFRDLAHGKYIDDDPWFKASELFSVSDVDSIVRFICTLQRSKVSRAQDVFTESGLDSDKLLGLFAFSIEELVLGTGIDDSVVRKVVQKFCIESFCNTGFTSMNEFNNYNAKPLISLGDDKFVILQLYSITEAFYESPYYWMLGDSSYINEAMENRGRFTENYSAERLTEVFGEE